MPNDKIDRKKILDMFLNMGYQLDMEALAFFTNNPKRVREFFNAIKTKSIKTTVVDGKLINSVFRRAPKTTDVKIIRVLLPKITKITIDDVINYYNSRYERIKKILEEKIDKSKLFSINRIAKRKMEFTIIAMVKEINYVSRQAIVEDATGELTIKFSKNKSFVGILPDDIAGFVCKKIGDVIKIEDIIWPDLPLRREVHKTKNRKFCIFISDLRMDSKDFKKTNYNKFIKWINEKGFENSYVFIFGNISSNQDDIVKLIRDLPRKTQKFLLPQKLNLNIDTDVGNVTQLSLPIFLKIDSLVIFLIPGKTIAKYARYWKDIKPEMIMLNLLKRRDLDPAHEIKEGIYERHPFIIDKIPDIFISDYQKAGSLNYKGTTVISTGSFGGQSLVWSIDLNNREVNKSVFS